MKLQFEVEMSEENIAELEELTGEPDYQDAIKAAIQFTLMHDRDSIREALKP